AGQSRRNERALLPSGARRTPLAASGNAAAAGAAAGNIPGTGLSPEELKKKRETDKKRLLVYVGLFFLAFVLYFSEGDNKTIKENAKLEMGEEPETKGKPKKRQTKKEIQ